MNSNAPSLIEPGVRYFIGGTLKECYKFKERHINTLFNIGMSAFGGGGGMTPIDASVVSPFAEGGSVRGGMPITVGERGRELFVPNTSGTIVPNHELANSGMNITFNIQANDVRGIKELLIDNRATIINLVNQGANQKGKSNVV